MHTRKHFQVAERPRIFEALRRFGFATLITADDGARVYASRLATILRRDADGRVRLWTHIDRRNPQIETLDSDHELLLVAYGPDCYLSPAWYLRHPSVPSWNYIAVHVRGRPRLFPDDQSQLIETLLRETVAEYESRRATPWSYEPLESFHNGLARGVLGFAIEIDEIAGSFKLSQDKPGPDRRSVIEGLGASDDSGARPIARLMAQELDHSGAYSEPHDIPLAPTVLVGGDDHDPA